MYCDRRGNGQKPTRTKPPRTIEIEFLQGTFVQDFCTTLTKNRGGPRCVTAPFKITNTINLLAYSLVKLLNGSLTALITHSIAMLLNE